MHESKRFESSYSNCHLPALFDTYRSMEANIEERRNSLDNLHRLFVDDQLLQPVDAPLHDLQRHWTFISIREATQSSRIDDILISKT